MVVLDPFSAASKPMPDWEAIPSQPLPFAATLHALDLNVQAVQRLPRPTRRDNERDNSKSTSPLTSNPPRRMSTYSASRVPLSPTGSLSAPIGSDAWMEIMVADCVDKAKGDLVIHNYGLEKLSTKIRDLRDLVTLSRKSPSATPSVLSQPFLGSPCSPSSTPADRGHASTRSHLLSGHRSFSRTHSAPPVSAAFFTNLHTASEESIPETPPRNTLLPAPQISADSVTAVATLSRTDKASLIPTRSFNRSKTGAPSLSRTAPSIGVYASQNRLTSLPTALFEIRNLTALSLRNNQLRSIPAAIGELVHLKELNISNNQIFLPSTILKLESLEQFWAHPNRWRQPDDVTLSHSGRLLGTTLRHHSHPVPALSSLCLTVLLSPRPPSNQPPLLGYDWDKCRDSRDDKHPLLDVSRLRDFLPASLKKADVERVIQAAKSASTTGERSLSGSYRSAWPTSCKSSEPDDAVDNAYYYPCPSPEHLEWYVNKDKDVQPMTHRVFLHPAEERFEWREIANVRNLPLKWQGCSQGCLDFLERDIEDDWPVVGEDEDVVASF